MIYFYLFNLVLLALALGLSIYAVHRGPGALNRTVALDMITAVTVGMLCLVTVWQDRQDTIPILLALTLVAFLTATSVARIIGQRSISESAPPASDLSDQLDFTPPGAKNRNTQAKVTLGPGANPDASENQLTDKPSVLASSAEGSGND